LDRLTNEKKPRTKTGPPTVDLGRSELRHSQWAEDLGQYQPVTLSVVADTRLALPALRLALRQRGRGRDRSARCAELARTHREIRERWEREAREDWDAAPMTAARLASEIWSVIKDEDWVLTANTLEDWALRLWDVDGPQRHPGRSFGTATQIGTSLGIALAHRGTDKLVVDIQPDGDLLYDPGALWTAAHHRIPLLVVMYNNRAYYNDWEHQLRVAQHRGTPKENARVGQEIDDPAPAFALDAGIFKKNGLDVELLSVDGGSRGMATLLSGEIDIATLGGAECLSATASGAKVTVTAVGTPVFPYFLMAAPEIKTVADLRGK